jgi:hypothetical protein
VGYLDSVQVTRSTSSIIEVKMDCLTGETKGSLTIQLLLEDGQWKLDTQTWLGELA